MHTFCFLFAILMIQTVSISSLSYECNIYNDEYRGEWLFIEANSEGKKGDAVNTFALDNSKPWFYTSEIITDAQKGVFYYEPNILGEYGKKAVWRIEQVENDTNEFYIINQEF